jgi:hypothetical protein
MFAVVDAPDAGIAVDACSVRERFFLMAARAVDRLRRNVIVRMFGRQIAMATGAGSLSMRRTGEDRGIRKQRADHSGRVGGCQRFIVMTLQTIAVFDFGSRQGRRPQKPRGEGYHQANIHATSVAPGGATRWPLIVHCFANFVR